VAQVRQQRPQDTQDVVTVNYPERDSLIGRGHPCLTGRCYSGRWKPNPGLGRFERHPLIDNSRQMMLESNSISSILIQETIDRALEDFATRSIDCTHLNELGAARHGYVDDAPFIETLRDARYHYAKRFGIESSFRLSEQAIATTITRGPTVRLPYIVVSLLLQNTWRYLRYSMWRRPPRRGVASDGGRLRSSSIWFGEQRGRPDIQRGHSPQIDRLTTGSSGNHPHRPTQQSGW